MGRWIETRERGCGRGLRFLQGGNRQAPAVQGSRQGPRVARDSNRRTYGQATRPFRTEPAGLRWTGAGFYIGRQQETFDAEAFAIMRAIHVMASRRQTGRDFTIFTDSQVQSNCSLKGTSQSLCLGLP